jgi:hypothetical protein
MTYLRKIMDKEAKYKPLIEDIKKQEWTIAPIIVITVGARRAIYQITKIQVKQSLFKPKTPATKKHLKLYTTLLSNFLCALCL